MNSMNKDELKAFLNRPYPGTEDFLQHIIFPIFGQDKFVDEYEKDYLDEPSWQKKAEAAGISHIYTLGHIKAVKPIHLFDVTVSDHVRMARNRVSLQLIIRNILKSKSGSAGAFMVFRYEDSRRHEWRFSFCYKAHEDEKSTDAKRFTFLFGPNHSCRTAAENFLNLFQRNAEGQRVKVEDIQKAFSVEALSKEFFDKYREHYARFVLHATGKRYVKQANKWEERTEHAPDEAIMQAFGGDEKRVRDYVKKLLGRIVFLHFLQKKGWMGVPNGGRWGEGKFRFMYKLFEEATAEQQADFVHEVLEHLFFHALNTDRKADNDLYDTRVFGEKVRVPYLNGGLFEEDDADRCFKACTDARFPAELFRELFAFFEQYNFTIDENDPDDAQVGVDPEMLGRIFESLLEDNKKKGAFYTPKEIVQYMCRRSLTAYLQADVPDERMRKKIDEFVRTKDYDCLRLYLPLSRREQVAERLRTVKICDPAIGSGAFPMGLLRELYLCRIALEDEVKEDPSKSHAEIKKEILQQNIYGVDLDRGAVDIARLRFWLSLVVDEELPQPLPNLDYKIMQGNSLLERYKDVDLSTLMPPQEIAGDRILSLFDEQVDLRSQKLSEAKRRFYSATSHEEKEHLRSEIHRIIQERFDGVDGQNIDLSGVNVFANPNFFLWHTWFSEVFSRPILRGKDIKRYSYDWAGLWLINTHNGVKGELPPIDITLYPAIKAHLDSHWDRIARRSDQGITPYNLRDCAYIKDFEKPKIIWKIIGSRLAFTIDINGIMVNNACYIMTGDSLMHILGFLNSAPLIWYSEITNMNKTGVGDAQVGAQNIKLFPVPINPNKEIERLVEQLLSNPTDDNARQLLSERIDSIYGLTKEERHYLELLNL